jgi:hypothetical protein
MDNIYDVYSGKRPLNIDMDFLRALFARNNNEKEEKDRAVSFFKYIKMPWLKFTTEIMKDIRNIRFIPMTTEFKETTLEALIQQHKKLESCDIAKIINITIKTNKILPMSAHEMKNSEYWKPNSLTYLQLPQSDSDENGDKHKNDDVEFKEILMHLVASSNAGVTKKKTTAVENGSGNISNVGLRTNPTGSSSSGGTSDLSGLEIYVITGTADNCTIL